MKLCNLCITWPWFIFLSVLGTVVATDMGSDVIIALVMDAIVRCWK